MFASDEQKQRLASDPMLLRVLDWSTQAFNICGTLLIVGLMFLICADVLSRNLAGAPIPGVPELVTLSIVAIVFLQAPQALKDGRFPRADILQPVLERCLGRRAKLLLDLFDLLGAAVLGIIAYATWPMLVRTLERGEFIGAHGYFTAPVWPVKLMVLAGSILLMLQFLALILRRRRGAQS